jgi:hypothetical protein
VAYGALSKLSFRAMVRLLLGLRFEAVERRPDGGTHRDSAVAEDVRDKLVQVCLQVATGE